MSLSSNECKTETEIKEDPICPNDDFAIDNKTEIEPEDANFAMGNTEPDDNDENEIFIKEEMCEGFIKDEDYSDESFDFERQQWMEISRGAYSNKIFKRNIFFQSPEEFEDYNLLNESEEEDSDEHDSEYDFNRSDRITQEQGFVKFDFDDCNLDSDSALLLWNQSHPDQVLYNNQFSFETPISEDGTLKNSLQYFQQFFDFDTLKLIVDQSNLYSIQKNPKKPLSLDLNELERWLGLCLYFSICKISCTKLYWSQSVIPDIVTSTMSRERFLQIMSNFHLVDNSNNDPEDKIFKVRPLLDHLRKKFKEVEMHEVLCIDEHMIPFNKISRVKQYIPEKSHKWGFKFVVLTDSKGYVYDFIPYVGKINPVENKLVPDLGQSLNSVLHLAEAIPSFKNHKIYLYDWFTSVALFKHLATRGIWCTGTVQPKTLPGLALKTDKQLLVHGMWSHDEQNTVIDNIAMAAVKWIDSPSRSVCLLSTFLQAEPIVECEKFNKKNNVKVKIPVPNIVKLYNQNIGGVDVNEELISLYRITFQVKKYYLKMIFHMIDLTVVNSWLLYRRDAEKLSIPQCKQITLLQFKLSLAVSLLKAGKQCFKKRGRKSDEEMNFQNKKKMSNSTQSI